MTSAESSRSDDSERSKKPTTLSKRRIKSWLGWHSWEHHPPQALVYQQGNPHLDVEEISSVNKESNCFEIQLPRWSNLVLVYADMEDPSGLYPTALRLDRLGIMKNWQRRLRLNYEVLHIKAKKPE